jgi:hypothetical protein
VFTLFGIYFIIKYKHFGEISQPTEIANNIA